MIGNSTPPSSDDPETKNSPLSEANLEERKAADRLKEAVRRAGGNAAVAKRAGISLGTLNNYLGGRDMKTTFMVALAKACGVNITWLASGEGPMVGQLERPASDARISAENDEPEPPVRAAATMDVHQMARAIETMRMMQKIKPDELAAEEEARLLFVLYDQIGKM
jgi:AcrR family transcriptional regulator